jgi:hypothetical protein
MYGIFVRKSEEKGHCGDPCVDSRIILKWILEKLYMRAWSGFICVKIEISV